MFSIILYYHRASLRLWINSWFCVQLKVCQYSAFSPIDHMLKNPESLATWFCWTCTYSYTCAYTRRKVLMSWTKIVTFSCLKITVLQCASLNSRISPLLCLTHCTSLQVEQHLCTCTYVLFACMIWTQPSFTHTRVQRCLHVGVCVHCVLVQSRIEAMSQFYHPHCFACHHCNQTIGGTSFHVENNQFYCQKGMTN